MYMNPWNKNLNKAITGWHIVVICIPSLESFWANSTAIWDRLNVFLKNKTIYNFISFRWACQFTDLQSCLNLTVGIQPQNQSNLTRGMYNFVNGLQQDASYAMLLVPVYRFDQSIWTFSIIKQHNVEPNHLYKCYLPALNGFSLNRQVKYLGT